MRMGIKESGAYVEIGADASQLVNAVAQAEARLSSLQSSNVNVSVRANTSGATSQIRGISSALGNLQYKASDAVGVVESAVNSFDKLAGTMAISVGVMGISESIKASAELDKALSTLKSITKATASEFEALEARAKSLGASTSWSTREVVEGMTALARVGFNTNDIERSITTVMNAARGLGISVEGAGEMIASTLNQFGKGTDSAERFADVIVTITNSAALAGQDFAMITKYAAPAASAIDQSVENLAVLGGVAANSGMALENIGSSLRNFFTLLASSSEAVAKFENVFGTRLKNAKGEFRNMVDVMREASIAASQMGSSLSGELLGIGVEKSDLATLMSILSNSGEIDKLSEAMEGANGASAKLAKDMDDNLFGALKKAESAFAAISDTFARTVFNKDIAGTVNSIASIVSKTNEWVESHKELVRFIGEAVLGYKMMQAIGSKMMPKGSVAGTTPAVGYFATSGTSSVKARTENLEYIANVTGKNARVLNTYKTALDKANLSFTAFMRNSTKWNKQQNPFAQQKAYYKQLEAQTGIKASQFNQIFNQVNNIKKAGISVQQIDRAFKSVNKRIELGKRLMAGFSNLCSGVAKQLAGMFVMGLVIRFVEELVEGFTAAARKSAEIRENLKQATQDMVSLASSMASKDVYDRKQTEVRQLIEDARNYDNMSDKERAVANARLNEATRSGLINEANADALKGRRRTSLSEFEWDRIEAGLSDEAVKASAEKARKTAVEANNSLWRDYLNEAMGTHYETNSEAATVWNEKHEWDRTRTGLAESDMAYQVQQALFALSNKIKDIVNDDSLDEFGKQAKILEAKNDARVAFEAARMDDGDWTTLRGSYRLKKVRQANKFMWENIDAYIEMSKAGHESAKVMREGVKPLQLPDIEFEKNTKGGVLASNARLRMKEGNEALMRFIGGFKKPLLDAAQRRRTDKAERDGEFNFMKTNAMELAKIRQDMKDRQDAIDKAEAEAKKGLSNVSSDITQEEAKKLVNAVQVAENNGVDLSEEKRKATEDIQKNMKEASESLSKVSTGFTSTVFTDSISAAFSASNVNALSYQKEQLEELRKLVDKATQQYNINAEILSQL